MADSPLEQVGGAEGAREPAGRYRTSNDVAIGQSCDYASSASHCRPATGVNEVVLWLRDQRTLNPRSDEQAQGAFCSRLRGVHDFEIAKGVRHHDLALNALGESRQPVPPKIGMKWCAQRHHDSN